MRATITKIAKRQLADEVRFISADDLTGEFVGDPQRFIGRQPRDVLPTARSVILVSVYIGGYILPAANEYGRMSRLVLSGFYSNVVKPLLPIKEFLEARGYRTVAVDGATAQAAIPIKGAAVKAGLGWIGKNTLLLSERYGSLQALGAVLTEADLGQDNAAAVNRCGSCTSCMTACPTKAIRAPQDLAKPRCLSYLFGVDAGDIPLAHINSQGYFFECDICQNICPWNRRHLQNPLSTPFGSLFEAEKTASLLHVQSLCAMDETAYQRQLVPLMSGSKIPYSIFRRNLRVLRNSVNNPYLRACDCQSPAGM